MITLYGITRSRTSRCLWMLYELGIPFERVLINQTAGENRQPDYLKVNPNGRVPTLRDGDLTLWESMAINLYLAEKYGKGLMPAAPEERARCYQWSVWVMVETEGAAFEALRHAALLPEDQRSPEAFQKAVDRLRGPLGVLDGQLEGRQWLLGDSFTVADLNVAAVLNWAYRARVPMDDTPRTKDWLARCLDRPAQRKVVEDMRAGR